MGDGEWQGLDFLPEDSATRMVWAGLLPRRGSPPIWDAVARTTRGGVEEWLLVEAKANIEELRSSCRASPQGGRSMIERALDRVNRELGVPHDRDWLTRHYQLCNRVAVLHALKEQGVAAPLLFIHFVGDRGGPGRTCPGTAAEWAEALTAQNAHVGLPAGHPLDDRIRRLFLEVAPR
ncbi:hypothetical protein ABAZ39_13015 [Azospirillum argentinense]|uniref:Uncharacterized protein n=1 Tax=Azospirillum argentinense TaxID=2970906 RepID=A0A060DJ01_9PROT|nr:hypothetical protein [Azospirillum argentinense]AIB12892.1 hypothetical protein ABAZ39_13015 [Azospirillum argentinense]EZQ09890.1 hypothetical protein ABAZ39_14420 [Azospirillum argentinense]